MVLWDLACLVDVAALVTAAAVLVKVAKLIAVLAEVEGFAALSVVAALTTPAACIKLNVGAVGPGVVKDFATMMNFFSSHEVGGWVFKDYLWGQPVVGIGLGEGA